MNNTKHVSITKEDDFYILDITTNGFQWHMVYRGTLEECKVLRNAFVTIGFKFVGKGIR